MSLFRDAATGVFFRRGVSSKEDSCVKDVQVLFKKAARAAPVKNDPVADNRRVTSVQAKIVDDCCEAIKSATSSCPEGRVSLADAVEVQFGAAGETELTINFAAAYSEAMRLVISADDPNDTKETETTHIPPTWTKASPPWQTAGQAMTEENVSGLPCLL